MTADRSLPNPIHPYLASITQEGGHAQKPTSTSRLGMQVTDRLLREWGGVQGGKWGAENQAESVAIEKDGALLDLNKSVPFGLKHFTWMPQTG
jgi:hypothetical protein